MNEKHENNLFKIFIEEFSSTCLRAFPAIWDENYKRYIVERGTCFGGRLVYSNNSAGYNFKFPAILF
jgi:hypothetical protein